MAGAVEGVRGGALRGRIPGGASLSASGDAEPGARATLSIRPERLSIDAPDAGVLQGVVEHIVYLGTDTQHLVRADGGALITVRTQNAHSAANPAVVGDRVSLIPDKGAARLLTT